MNIVGWQIVKYAVRRAHLRATKTDNARSATEPNTFLKNKAATVTPLASISSYSYLSVEWEVQTNKWNSCLASSSEVSNVRKHIQNRANTKAKGACYFKSPHGIADVVHHIVHIGPSRVSIQDFESGGSVLPKLCKWMRICEHQRTDIIATCRAPCESVPKVDVWIGDASLPRENHPAWDDDK